MLLWTFRIMNMPEATFNSAPTRPRDRPLPEQHPARDRTTAQVNLQAPPTGASQSQQDLFNGPAHAGWVLHHAAIVSENSNTLGPIDTGSRLDPGSLATGTRFLKLTPGGTQPNVKPCLSCASSGPGTTAQPAAAAVRAAGAAG